MTMVCKKCRKAFRKDVSDLEGQDEADEYCPHCDNHFLREAVTKKGIMDLGKGTTAGGEDLRKDAVGSTRIIRDDRIQGAGVQTTLEALADSSGRLG